MSTTTRLNISCVVIDGKKEDRDTLELLLRKYPEMEIKGVFRSVSEAMAVFSPDDIQLYFLDIEMPNHNSLDFVKYMGEDATFIFTTAFPEYALDGFESQSLDFISKPFSEERLSQGIRRAITYFDYKRKAELHEWQTEQEAITLRQNGAVVKIPADDIFYLEALKDYTRIFTQKKNYMTLMSFRHVLRKMPENTFVRIHRSYAINTRKINTVQAQEITLENYAALPIGKMYKQDLMKYAS